MKVRFEYAVFLLGLALPTGVEAQELVPLKITEQGHLLMKVWVNEVEGNFILDTGAGMTVLTRSFASKVRTLKKLDGGYTGFRATGERMGMDLFTAEQLAIGKYVQKSPLITIIEANFGEIDGLVSLMNFQNQPFTIDSQNKKLFLETSQSLTKRKRIGSRIALQLEKSRDKSLDVFAYFTLNNGVVLQFLLDSGAGNNVFMINSKHISTLGIDTTDASTVSRTYKRSEFNPNFRTAIYKTIVAQLACKDNPGIQRTNVRALFLEGLIYDGAVSINWMGNQITFDLENSEMIVN